MNKKKAAMFAVGTAACGAVLAVADVYRYTFYRSRSALSSALLHRKSHNAEYYDRRKQDALALENRPHEVLTMASDRGYTLNGFYYRAGSERSKTICYIVHGYRSDHADTAGPFAGYYLSRGIDIFCDDHVASGVSGGHFIGYDYLETMDCLKWIELLKKRFGSDIRIILHGFSMGGATVANMSDKCPDNVKFIVCDSGYTSAKELLTASGDIKIPWFFGALNALNRLIAKYDLRDTDVRPAVRNTSVPMLFVHGTDDPTVPPEMGRELYGICSAPTKELLLVDGARHVESVYRDPDAYMKALDSFLKRCIA